MADQSFTAAKEHDGKTLAAFLRACLVNLSWSDARHLIGQRQVQVNGVLCVDDARRLRAGDTVELRRGGGAPPTASSIPVIFQDEHIIVVEKPAGIEAERRPEQQGWSAQRKALQPTLVELIEGKGLRPLPVHRLDRDTSGLMVYALTGPAREKLVAQFSAHSIERRYLAVVLGTMHDIEVRNWIIRDRGDGIRGCIDVEVASAQNAISRFHVRERIGTSYSVVECQLETGRTHQIRLHLAHLGHRVCGERLYLSPALDAPPALDASDAPRQALHAAVLGFSHPMSSRAMRFERDWPADLSRWLSSIREKVKNQRI